MSDNDPTEKEIRAVNAEIVQHREDVRRNVNWFIGHLQVRATTHDGSKNHPEELIPLAKLKKTVDAEGKAEYGTPEYEERKATLASMLKHHYAHNRHHPEHFPGGVRDMTLVDLVEMFCDWKAAGEARNPDGRANFTAASEKYDLPPMLRQVFANTLKEMDS